MDICSFVDSSLSPIGQYVVELQMQLHIVLNIWVSHCGVLKSPITTHTLIVSRWFTQQRNELKKCSDGLMTLSVYHGLGKQGLDSKETTQYKNEVDKQNIIPDFHLALHFQFCLH